MLNSVPREWAYNSFKPGYRTSEPMLRAAGHWFRQTMLDEQKDGLFEAISGARVRAGQEDPNTLGGFLVPDAIEDIIISRRNLVGVFRAHARVRPMGSDSLPAPRRTGGFTAYFVGENTALTESNATWDNVNLSTKKLAALTRVSNELYEDNSVDLGAWITDELGYAFGGKEDDCGFNGDGTSPYGGIRGICPLLLDGNHGAGKVAAASGHNLFTELDGVDLGSLIGVLPEYALAGASWYASSYAIANTFSRLNVVSGGNIMTATGPRPLLSYLGFPIVPCPKMPGAGSQLGKVMLLFGDLSLAATLGDRRGVTVRQSRHRYIELDQLGIRGTERVDIVCHDLGDNSLAGPLVGLVGSA
jgi:HK97 family phage major capsid protein